MAYDDLPSGFDECDRVSLLNCVMAVANTLWLDDNMINGYMAWFCIVLLSIDDIYEIENLGYLMIGIALCITLNWNRRDIIHGIVSRRKTVAVADIGLAEDRTAGAYGWILCMQFKWIVFAAVLLLWWIKGAIEHDWLSAGNMDACIKDTIWLDALYAIKIGFINDIVDTIKIHAVLHFICIIKFIGKFEVIIKLYNIAVTSGYLLNGLKEDNKIQLRVTV